jgi:hypothetical protein
LPIARIGKALLKAIGWLFLLVGLPYALLLAWVWNGRTEISVRSAALGEQRNVTLFGNDTSVIIYALDGDKYRHGLLPAANGALIAWLSGKSRPLIVAIHDHGGRDRDFRPAKVKPAYWRPDISGRAAAFDIFLLEELPAVIERRRGVAEKRYLFGYSLGGFYALDMPTRQKQHGFAGIYAFSPTFSHDLSLIDRISASCVASRHIYVNIGLESGRDTEVFNKAENVISRQPPCKGRIRLARHPGAVHQLVMLTGQIAAFGNIYWTDGA